MSPLFWSLLVVNAVLAGLVTLALPHGPNFIYALMAGSQLGMLGMLGWKWRENGANVFSSRPRNGDPTEGSPPFPPWPGR